MIHIYVTDIFTILNNLTFVLSFYTNTEHGDNWHNLLPFQYFCYGTVQYSVLWGDGGFWVFVRSKLGTPPKIFVQIWAPSPFLLGENASRHNARHNVYHDVDQRKFVSRMHLHMHCIGLRFCTKLHTPPPN